MTSTLRSALRASSALRKAASSATPRAPRQGPDTLQEGEPIQARTTFGVGPLGVALNDPGTYDERRVQAVEALERMGYSVLSMVEQSLRFRDHDAFQHVNNKHSLAWMEDGRAVWMSQIARQCSTETQRAWQGGGTGIGLILHSSSIRWKRPLKSPDVILIGTKPTSVHGRGKQPDRFDLETTIYSFEQQAVATTGTSTIVCYDYDRETPTALPDDVREAIEAEIKP